MPRHTLLILALVAGVSYVCYSRADHQPYGRYFSQVMEEIDRQFVEPVDDQQLFEGAIKGMVGELDEFSGYINQDHAGEFQQMVLDQRFGGIGIELDARDEKFLVRTPIMNSPAYDAGIQAEDQILAIDGVDTQGLKTQDVINRLRGDPGQPVTLTITRPGDTKSHQYRIVRREIELDSVLGDTRNSKNHWNFFLPGHDGIGYVRITSFGERTPVELSAALDCLADLKAKGLILDLRENPGGLLNSATDVAEMFLDEGDLIVTTRGRDHQVLQECTARLNGRFPDLPMVVLVDRNSASAAEIVAAALQDHHRAVIVGERSYGKGTVQNVIPIEGGKSVLKLTIATYWRPSGQNIHRLESSQHTDQWGVKPDPGYDIPWREEELATWTVGRRQRDVIRPQTDVPQPSVPADKPLPDRQLEKALDCMNQILVADPTAKAA